MRPDQPRGNLLLRVYRLRNGCVGDGGRDIDRSWGRRGPVVLAGACASSGLGLVGGVGGGGAGGGRCCSRTLYQ
eukprot:COSAG02_NODE_334_length_24367_cov_6.715634_25_plen_74_part_00